MAKKDKRSRDFDSPSSPGDIIDEFTSSIEARNSEFEESLKAARRETPETPLVDDTDEEDENEGGGPSFLFALPIFLVGLPGKIVRGGIFGVMILGRGLLLPLRLAGSLLQRGTEDDEEEDSETETASPTIMTKVDAAEMLADEDEDGDYSSRAKWFLRGGVAAAVLVLAASGYFGYKTVSARSKATDAAMAQDGSDTNETKKTADAKTASPDPLKAEAKSTPKVAKNEQKPVEKAAPKKPETPEKKPVVAPPLPVAAEKAGKKTEVKPVAPVAAKPDPKTAAKTPEKTVAAAAAPKPAVKTDVKAPPVVDKKDTKVGVAEKTAVGAAAAATVAAAATPKVDVKAPVVAPKLATKPDAKTPEKADVAAKTATKAPAASSSKPDAKKPEVDPKNSEKALAATAAPKSDPKAPVAPPAKPDSKTNDRTPEKSAAGAVVTAAATVPAKTDAKPAVTPSKPEPKANTQNVALAPPKPAAKVPEAAPVKPAEKTASPAPEQVSDKATAKVNDPWAVAATPAPTANPADPWGVTAQTSAIAPPTPPVPASDKKPAAASSDPWALPSSNPPAVKTPTAAVASTAAATPPKAPDVSPEKPAPVKTNEPVAPVAAPLTASAAPPTPTAAPESKNTAAPPAVPANRALPSLAAAAPSPAPNTVTAAAPQASKKSVPTTSSPAAPLAAASMSNELENSSPLKPLAKRRDAAVDKIDEQAPAIPPNQGQALTASAASKSGTTLFGQVPTAPALETAPPVTTPMMPPLREAPKAETTPTISHTGNVAQITNPNLAPPKKPEISETVPAIPVAPAAGSTAAFTTPTTAPRTSASTLPAMEEQPRIGYAPPAFNTPSVPGTTANETSVAGREGSEPARMASAFAPLVAAAPPEIQEASPTIPAEPNTSIATPVTPVTPMLPQHTELAKTERLLGSQLQSGVQEIREQIAETPRIRFASSQEVTNSTANPSTTEGAVRFTPRTAANPGVQPLPMPSHSNEKTDLSLLLPSGNVLETPENAAVLPSLETAPTSVLAPVNTGYGRSMRNRNPAPVDIAARTTDRERRAMSFQQRISAEIKRSPTETEQYVVQEGDTYMTICDRAYGSSRPFRALAEHNRQKLGVDYRPQPGTTVEIPPANFLETNYSESFRPGRRRSATRATGSAAGTYDSSSYRQDRQGVPYVVQQGDTVFNIATDKLKDTSLWREILAMNADRIADPRDQLPAGTEIMLPTFNNAQPNVVRR